MSTDPILDPTAATEAALDIESIKEIMDAFDPATLLPELGDIFSLVTGICRREIFRQINVSKRRYPLCISSFETAELTE